LVVVAARGVHCPPGFAVFSVQGVEMLKRTGDDMLAPEPSFALKRMPVKLRWVAL
jgi:hypothetical protein